MQVNGFDLDCYTPAAAEGQHPQIDSRYSLDAKVCVCLRNMPTRDVVPHRNKHVRDLHITSAPPLSASATE